MRTHFVSIFWMAFGAAALLPVVGVAQVPFSSTQSPGLSPFNRGGSNPPPASAPRTTINQPNYANGNTAGSYPPTAPAVTGPIDPDHKLGPRDVLSYRVAEDRDEKVYQLAVTDSGEVELPLGSLRVKATGKTTQQLASDIKGVLEREYYKPGHATVSLGLVNAAQNTSRGRVYITGEVSGHGVIDLPVDGQLTVVQAILQVGGFTLDSDLKAVFILRKGAPREGIRVNAKAVLNGESDKDVVLQPGDTIKVKKKIIGVSF